jgi:hypothetical protein
VAATRTRRNRKKTIPRLVLEPQGAHGPPLSPVGEPGAGDGAPRPSSARWVQARIRRFPTPGCKRRAPRVSATSGKSPRPSIPKMTAPGVVRQDEGEKAPRQPPRTVGPSQRVRPVQRPKLTATAFPPRKPRNGEKAWPRAGARATGTRAPSRAPRSGNGPGRRRPPLSGRPGVLRGRAELPSLRLARHWPLRGFPVPIAGGCHLAGRASPARRRTAAPPQGTRAPPREASLIPLPFLE